MTEKAATKKCWICGMRKELTAFAANSAKPDGRRTECIICRTVEKRVTNNRKRAREAGSAADLTVKQLRELMSFSTSCIYCGDSLENLRARELHLDHVKPISRGGESSLGNLVMCCQGCSLSKGEKSAIMFTDKTDQLIRLMAMDGDISKAEAAILLASDLLAAQGVENADQLAAAMFICESFGITTAAPIEWLISTVQHFFAQRFGLILDDPADVDVIRQAIEGLIEFERQGATS